MEIDKIICLSLTEREDRRNFMKQQFEKLGLLDKVYFKYTCHIPFENEMAAYLAHNYNFSKTQDIDNINWFSKGSVFNCCREWYSIMKNCYDLGYKNVLGFEDDVLIKDFDKFKKYLENIPENFDLIRFGVTNPIKSDLKEFGNDYYYKIEANHPYYNDKFGGLMCCLFNRKIMDFFIDFINKNGYVSADHPIMNLPSDINNYCSKERLIETGMFKSNISCL
jgi:GR25 family glycosyltransferase involved in LPS biosynthesis